MSALDKLEALLAEHPDAAAICTQYENRNLGALTLIRDSILLLPSLIARQRKLEAVAAAARECVVLVAGTALLDDDYPSTIEAKRIEPILRAALLALDALDGDA